MNDDTIHAAPVDIGVTPCCGRTLFELSGTDRVTMESELVTCSILDDALLASVMRKLLDDEHGWFDYARPDERWPGPGWMTIDVRQVELTDDEYAAVERAGRA